MADGRKIQYLIELLPDTKQFEKIRNKMQAIDGGEFIKFEPSEVKKLKGILQGVVDDVGKRANSIGTKIQQGIASGIDKDKLQKMLDLDTSKLRETMEIVEKLTGLIDDHSKGSSWLKDGKGFLGKLSGSQQDLRNLEQSIGQLELKFEGLDDSLTNTIAKFDALATAIRSLQDNGKPIVVSPINITTGTKQVQQFEKEISKLQTLMEGLSGKKLKKNDNALGIFTEAHQEVLRLQEVIEELENDADKPKFKGTDEGRVLRTEIAERKLELAKLHLQMQKADEKYLQENKGKKSLLFSYGVEDVQDVVKEARTYTTQVVKELSNIETNVQKQGGSAVGVEVALPSVDDIKKKLNSVIDQLNKPGSLHKVKLEVDAANVIEDKDKRGYGENEAIEDVNTANLVSKTEERFDKIAKSVKNKQDLILTNTKAWRTQMIEAMKIGSSDLNFQFGWDKHIEPAAESLFNKLQEYFEQPEYALDIKFNTEKIARDLKASLEAEGIELDVSDRTANIDAKSLMSMLHSILYGGTLVHTTTQTSGTSGNSTQKEVAAETDDAVDSSKEYVKVLDETTIHIDKVIEALREFAREATKAKASKGAKAIAEKLYNTGIKRNEKTGEIERVGIDLAAIKNGATDTEIIKMVQNALMAKDEMGQPKGGALSAEIKAIMSSNSMDAKNGAGKVAELLAFHIKELFDINEIETELEAQVEKRFKQLNLWRGVEKPGRAFAALGSVRSTEKKTRLPEMQTIKDAITYFKDAGENTDALEKLQGARQKFEDSGETDEARAEFEKSALIFYDETKDVFKRLKARWGDFKGTVSVEGRKPILINPKGAYPSRILEIPKDAVITKVEPFEAFEVVDGTGHVGSSARRESSVRKAEQEQKKLNYGASGYDFMTQKPRPKKDVRYEGIEYDTFKTQESNRLRPDVSLDASLQSLEKLVKELPEIVERIENGKVEITKLEEIKQQIKNEISNIKIQDLPEIKMDAFGKSSKSDNTIARLLRDSKSALQTNSLFDTGDISHLDKEQHLLVTRLNHLVQQIHNDSKESQEFANKIAEITEAKKLSREELEKARAEAAMQGDDARKGLYTDLIFEPSSVDSRLATYESNKTTIDDKLNKNRERAQTIIDDLQAFNQQNVDKAVQEAQALAIQLTEIKDRLYAEAETYVNILNDANSDDSTREVALGKLQQTLSQLNQVSGKFANIQAYVPQTYLYNDTQQNNVDKWNKTYTSREVTKLEKELRVLEEQVKQEDDQTKIAELKKQIANKKRELTRLKKIVPENVVSKKQTELSNIERQIDIEQSQLEANENRKGQAENAQGSLQRMQKDVDFLTRYNELLAKEKSLLEEVNKLKREGADKSVIDNKIKDLRQATKELDDFINKEQTVERTAYAREAAVEYQAQLQTAYRKRSVFDNRLQELDDEEDNLNKYGLSGRVGSGALRKAKRKATNEYMSSDEVREQVEAIRSNEEKSWQQRDEEITKLRQKLRKEFEDKFDSSNVKQNELDRIAVERRTQQEGRAPLDKIIQDLQSQKKAAMRYGSVTDSDLSNDKYLNQNKTYNDNIIEKTEELIQKQKELEDIKSDGTLDEKSQEKQIRAKQKEIDAINQEIQRNQDLIDNRIKLMELHKQEKEESKQTPEEKALLATEKLVSMKQSLAQAEEKIVARRTEYESAKGTENEVKMLEALDNQIKKRDQIQEQIADTEKKIERLGQITQKTEETQDEVASTVEGATSGEVSGGLLGLIKEVVGEVGSADLTKVEETLGKILEVLNTFKTEGIKRGGTGTSEKSADTNKPTQDAKKLYLKQGESLKDKMETMALKEHGILGKRGGKLTNPKYKYDFLGFDGDTLTYQLTDIEGKVRQVTMVWDELTRQVSITSDKSVAKLDVLAGKVEDFGEKFKNAVQMGYLSDDDAVYKAFKDKVANITTQTTLAGADKARNEALRAADEVTKKIASNKRLYTGTTEMNAATRQYNNLDASGILDQTDLQMVIDYKAKYAEIVKIQNEWRAKDKGKGLLNPEAQKQLHQASLEAKNLGKELEKAANNSQRLQQAIDSSGTYHGQSIGGRFQLEENVDKYDVMIAKLQELGAEHIKVDRVRQTATGTIRHNNKIVSDLTVEYDKLSNSLVRYQKQERESLTGLPAFLNGFQKKFNSIMQYLTMTMSIHQVMAQLRKGVQYIKEIDLALTELRKVTDETEATYDKFLQTAAKTGERLGSTISAVTEATATFAKLGYTMVQATEMAEAAIVYKNVGDNIASTEDAANSIISTMKGFGLEASESMAIVDKFNEVGNRFAITSQGIGEALRLSASALNEGKNSLDESIALITAANEVVNDPSSVGTALKTLTLRLRGSKTE